jgi:broad specificity phosphatase PhoE
VSAAGILLVRHGQTDWNRDRRVQGWTDVPLNDEGRRQARALAATLDGRPFAAVYSSDLARALETAHIVVAERQLPVTPLEELREKHFGSWEGLTDAEVLSRFPDAHVTGWGDGETTDEMAARVVAAVQRISDAHPGDDVLVVTHGGPIRAVLRHCGAEDGSIGNCAAVGVASRDGVWLRVDD